MRFHREREAHISVAVRPVPIEQTGGFGILGVGSAGRSRAFEEKPVRGKPLPSDPEHALASMGNYLFDANGLLEVREDARARGAAAWGYRE